MRSIAGLFVLGETVTSDLVPQRQLGPYMGVVFAMAGRRLAFGLLIGGALADASWRWVYYIMVPIGEAFWVVLFFFLRVVHNTESNWRVAILRIDWVVSAILVPSVLAIMFGLVQGGITYT